jgi:hypothetical protein
MMRLKVHNIAKIFLDEVPNRLKLQCGVQKRTFDIVNLIINIKIIVT